MDALTAFNTFCWVTANVEVFVVFTASLLFSILYPILFNPSLTTGGKLIWRAILSVAAFGLLVCIGIFIDGRVEWWQYPGDVIWWRPFIRLAVYSFIGESFVSLVVLLILRRVRPEAIKVAPEDSLNLRPRDLHRRKRRV